jgi:hypothetical protein
VSSPFGLSFLSRGYSEVIMLIARILESYSGHMSDNYTPEQAIGMLREAEGRLSQGEKIGRSVAVLGSRSRATYRWRWTEGRRGATSEGA